MKLPDIIGPVFFAPLIIFPIALSYLRLRSLKETQAVMASLFIIWLALMWFGKGVFYHVINKSTNRMMPYFDYESKSPEIVKMLPSLEMDLDRLDPLVILGLLILSRWIYSMI